jgi:hypothetical protein
MDIERLLERAYTDPKSPVAFTGIAPLYRYVKARNGAIRRQDVVEFLQRRRSYTIHKPVRRKFRRLATIASGLHSQWEVDLADFQQIKNDGNDGFAFLLVCKDVLSRQIFVEPIKSKRAIDVKRGFEAVFQRAGQRPWSIRSDLGNEFCSREMQEFFRTKDILKFNAYTSPWMHCAHAENAIKLIKTRLWRYFSEKRTLRYIDVIQDIVAGLNRSHNRTIGMAPADVTLQNAEAVRKKLIAADRRRGTVDYKAGDYVRIEKYKHIFAKGYQGAYTEEIFKILRVQDYMNPVTYRLCDLSGEPIIGLFYAQDLSRVLMDDRTEHVVERVLKTRTGKNGKRQYFVKWLNYSDRFNSWVDELIQ